MNTCRTCQEFSAKNETCDCPLNAYPDAYSESGSYKYARTAADSNACGFYIPIKKVEEVKP